MASTAIAFVSFFLLTSIECDNCDIKCLRQKTLLAPKASEASMGAFYFWNLAIGDYDYAVCGDCIILVYGDHFCYK